MFKNLVAVLSKCKALNCALRSASSLASAIALSGALTVGMPASADEIPSLRCEILLQKRHAHQSLKYAYFRMTPAEFEIRMNQVEEALRFWDNSESEATNDALERSELALGRLRGIYSRLLTDNGEEAAREARPLTVALSKELDLLRRMASMDHRMSEHPEYLGINMLTRYQKRDKELGYLQLTLQQAEQYKVSIHNGRLFAASGKAIHAIDDVEAIYVLSVTGELYVKVFPKKGFFHHSTFLSGGAVAAAGKFKLNRGRLLQISDHSGHYAVPRALTAQLISYLIREGADLRDVDMEWTSPPESESAF